MLASKDRRYGSLSLSAKIGLAIATLSLLLIEPCRNEMPRLDKLYQSRKANGFVVLGISDEAIETQQAFLRQVPVTYPLLTTTSGVPTFYREIARYPAIFLIDREGRLQPAPRQGQGFEKVEEAVGALLHEGK
jgi:peroxiredoxin